MPYTNSAPVDTNGVSFMGLWIHDPLDPVGTIRNYLYGRATRSVGIDVGQQSMTFAGRTYPVVEYGEHQADSFGVQINIPEGPTLTSDLDALHAFAQVRRTLCFRDNRGRLFFGTMRGYKEDDQDWGSQVSFGVDRVDYDEGDGVTL